MNYKIIITTLIICLCAGLFCGCGIFGKKSEGDKRVDVSHIYETGSGTESDPYVITDCEELNAVRLNPSYSYKLGNDIDLTNYNEDGSVRANWVPIKKFSGKFDGDGHTVKGMGWTYNEDNKVSDTMQMGLFAYTNKATIKNLKLNVAISWKYSVKVDAEGNEKAYKLYVGALVGEAHDTRFQNCDLYGVIVINEGLMTSFGGAVGYADSCYFENINSKMTLKLGALHACNIGGIVGESDCARIKRCSYYGSITGKLSSDTDSNFIGGVVGKEISSSGVIEKTIVNDAMFDVFSYGGNRVTAATWVGLLVGYYKGSIKDSGASGTMTGKEGLVSGIFRGVRHDVYLCGFGGKLLGRVENSYAYAKKCNMGDNTDGQESRYVHAYDFAHTVAETLLSNIAYYDYDENIKLYNDRNGDPVYEHVNYAVYQKKGEILGDVTGYQNVNNILTLGYDNLDENVWDLAPSKDGLPKLL